MKFLIIDTYYPGFLGSFYQRSPGLAKLSYREQMKALLASCFGTSDYYSHNLNNIGHKAEDIIANNEIIQRQWAKENGFRVAGSGVWAKLQSLPLIHRIIGRPAWTQEIALAQIKKAQPDIIYVQDLSALNPATLREAKKNCQLLVGQIACPLPAKDNLKEFQLILTSFPHYVKTFRNMGLNSEYFKIAFDPRIVDIIGQQKRKYDVVFIGSYSYYHRAGTHLLEKVSRKAPIDFWGYGAENLSPGSPIKRNFHGSAWGVDMYKILAQSKIVINRHISAAKNNANNMRLYESTGMGAMLITDEKKNLKTIFKVNKEVVTYKTESDLVKKIKYYLERGNERNKIARAGQRRTLSDHNYQNRMKELLKLLNKYI